MGRFGALVVQFFAPGNLSSALGTKSAVEATFRERINGEGEATIILLNDSDVNTWAAVGNIAWAYKTDSVNTSATAGVVFCEPFTITRRATRPGTDLIEISGPDLLSELKRYTIFRPLGNLVTTATTLLDQAAGPSTTTLAVGAPAGNVSIQPVQSNSADVGREIRIELDNSAGYHVTVVENRVSQDGTWRYILRDRMPLPAAAGNDIFLRTRKLRLTDVTGFRDGIEVDVVLDNNSTHTTLQLDEPDNGYITLREGLPGAAGAGKAVTAKSYTGKSTSDVTTVMTYTGSNNWSAVFDSGGITGTQAGTAYAGGGETVYSILQDIAAETGETFRLRSGEAGTRGPKRQVRWLRSNPAAGSGGTLRLVEPTDANMASDSANVNRAIMLQRPEFAGEYDPVTQIIPVAGDAAVTLFSCSAAAVAAAATAGFTVVRSNLGLYTPPYIDWTSQTSAIGTHQRRVTFSEVTVDSTSPAALTAAADKMLSLAMQYMKARRATARLLTVECVSAIGIRPGDTVELVYTPPDNVYSLNFTAGQSEPKLYVQEVERTVSAGSNYPGVPISRLLLSPTPEAPERTGGRETGRRLQTVERLAAQANTARITNISVPSPGGAAPPATLSATTTNATTAGGHTHAVTAVFNSLAAGAAGALLKTDAAGSITLNEVRARYVKLSNAGGLIEGEPQAVQFYRRIENGITYLVGAPDAPTSGTGISGELDDLGDSP